MYDGLETLFQNGGPAGSGIAAGQSAVLDQTKQLLEQRKQMQDYDQNALLNPIAVQQKQQDLLKSQMENETTQKTMGGKIDATNAESLQKLTAAQMKRVGDLGRMAGEVGTLLSTVPEGLPRQTAALGWMKDNNIDPQSTAGQYILNNPPEKLFGVSQKMSQLSDAWIKANMEKQSGIEQERLRQKGAMERLQKEIDAGRFRDKSKQSINYLEKALVSGNWQNASTAYDYMAQQAQSTGDTETAAFYRQKADEYAQKAKLVTPGATPQAGGVDLEKLTQGNVPTQPTPTMPPTAARPGTPAPQPKPQISSEDQQAIDWAKSNPNDPRAKKILQLHGM